MSSEHEQAENSLAVHTKLLCSAVFVVGREPGEYARNDLRTLAHAHDWDGCSIDVDHEAGRVSLSTDRATKTAVYNETQGCTLLLDDATAVAFDPATVDPDLPGPTAMDWPMGDRHAVDPEPDAVDLDALATALDRAVRDDPPGGLPPGTRAIVVVKDGRVVGERYAQGFARDTRHVSWSMGKSVTGALVGILVGEGHFDVTDPAPIADWRSDPRQEITIEHLLRMSSGLDCRRGGEDAAPGVAADHHNRVYFDATDVFKFATGRPLAREPGTEWRYRNCDTLSLGKVIRDTVESTGREYLAFPQRALYDRIGVRNMVHEPDPYGNFIMTGYNYGTARDWARFGLLHLRDGMWEGERILPAGWVEYVTTPAPAHPEAGYGGQFWLNRGGALADVPRDAFSARGARGQLTMVVPSLDAVLVRLGHTPSHEDDHHDALAGEILACLGA